jgi:hypothetical protein
MSFLGKREQDDAAGTRSPHRFGVEGSKAWGDDEYLPSDASQRTMRRMPAAGVDRQTCGNLECLGRWKMPWRNRRRPIFEGRWGCSGACLQAIVSQSLRRERGDLRLAADEEAPHQHRIPLGLVMLQQGWITQTQLRTALDAQRCAGEGRFGEWLIRECGVSQAQVTRGLAAQWSCPVLPIDGFSPAAMSLMVPRVLVQELGLLPLRVAGSRILYVAFKDRLDASATFALEQISGLQVVSGLLDDAQFDSARGRLLESNFVKTEVKTAGDADGMAQVITAMLDQTQPVGSRIVRVHQYYWMRTWLERGSYSGIGTLPTTGEDVTDTLFTIGSSA